MSPKLTAIIAKIPIVRTLAICTAESRKNARTELYWTVGFAFLAIPIVSLIVLFSRSLAELPGQILAVVGRGELMIYAAAVCGTALYSLRHGISSQIPEAIRGDITPPGTLSTCTSICLFIALVSYAVRRMGEIHHITINDTLLNWLSLGVLILSLVLAYVVLSLKRALDSGATPASHEQTASFSQRWEAEGRA